MTKRRSVINPENTLSRKNLVFDKLIFSLSDVNESCRTRENNQLSYKDRLNLTSYEGVMIFLSFRISSRQLKTRILDRVIFSRHNLNEN